MKEARELYEALKASGAITHSLRYEQDVEAAYRRFGEIVGIPYREDQDVWNMEEMMAAWRAKHVS